MTDDNELVAIDLTDNERLLMSQAINEYWGPAGNARLLLGPICGVKNTAQWDALLRHLYDALHTHQPLPDLEWARALFLTEISVGSALVGAGSDSPKTVGHQDVFEVLRAVQVKISSYARFRLLLMHSDCWLPDA